MKEIVHLLVLYKTSLEFSTFVVRLQTLNNDNNVHMVGLCRSSPIDYMHHEPVEPFLLSTMIDVSL